MLVTEVTWYWVEVAVDSTTRTVRVMSPVLPSDVVGISAVE